MPNKFNSIHRNTQRKNFNQDDSLLNGSRTLTIVSNRLPPLYPTLLQHFDYTLFFLFGKPTTLFELDIGIPLHNRKISVQYIIFL